MCVNKMKPIFKAAVLGFILAAILITIGFLVDRNTDYYFVDILFFEGMIPLLIGLISMVGGFPVHVSLKGLGNPDAQYISSVNQQIEKKEDEINTLKNKKIEVRSGKQEKAAPAANPCTSVVMMSLLIGGGICVVLDIILVLMI